MVASLIARDHYVPNLDERCPFYRLVPKDLVENLEFRARVLREAQESETVRKDLWCMCRRDILFWFATFVYTLDPRLEPGFRKTPFIPYEFQEFMILDLLDSITDKTNRAIQKCRDMGATWICLGVIHHQWQFTEDFSAGLSSRDYECVVNSGDDAALFSRLDFMRVNQPGWLVGECNPLNSRWKHLRTNSSISAEQTTDNMFRAGRYTVTLLDEYAFYPPGMDHKADKASANVSECRWFPSTPNGNTNSFYRKCNPRDNDFFAPIVRRYQWTEHPRHVDGLYTSENGKLKILDLNYKWPKDYPFILDGTVRSAWLDRKSADLEWVKSKIAEELLGDFEGSGDPVFDHEDLLSLVEKTARRPVREGTLLIADHDVGEPGEFIDEINGPFRLWINLDAWGRVPPYKRFVIGVDVSKGTGASNDALSVWDRDTKEKVAQYVDCVLGDYKLAELAVATARLFNDAELIWELDGGFTFQKRVVDLGYGKFYYKRSSPQSLDEGKTTNLPGFKVTTQIKEQLIKHYVHSLMQDRAFNRDEAAIMECGRFRYSTKGGIVHERAENMDHPSGARANHGDIVTADALAVFLLTGYGRTEIKLDRKSDEQQQFNAMNHPDPPRNTAAWRYQQAMKKDRRGHLAPLIRESTAVF